MAILELGNIHSNTHPSVRLPVFCFFIRSLFLGRFAYSALAPSLIQSSFSFIFFFCLFTHLFIHSFIPLCFWVFSTISMWVLNCYISVQGGWSSWSVLTPCSVTCGNGTEILSRTCTNPEPKHGGEFCQGDTQKRQVCTQKPCPG